MKNYTIENVLVDGDRLDGGVVIAEARLRDHRDDIVYMSLSEIDGEPDFYLTDESTFEIQTEGTGDDDFWDHMDDDCCMNAGSYEEIFEEQDPDWYDLYRYLIYIVRAERAEAERYIEQTRGQQLSKIFIPAADVEEDMYGFEAEDFADRFTVDGMDEETLYRNRLAIEAALSRSSMAKDADGGYTEVMENRLSMINAAIASEEDYEAWKEKFTEDIYSRVRLSDFIVCRYVVPGVGAYESTMLKTAMGMFKAQISRNSSALYAGEREATEEDVKLYIALHAAD